jgi:Pyridoxal/pyridoxine/pyridoxamine kinase
LCSLSVCMPILGQKGIDVCPLPTAVLSAHTGYNGFTFRDLTEDFPAIFAHWKSMNIKFDLVYTGYFASEKQIDYTIEFIKQKPSMTILVDPVMGDDGALYTGFAETFPAKMLSLCKTADIITPNLTEAALLLGIPFPQSYTESDIGDICKRLYALTNSAVAVTGLSFTSDTISSALYKDGNFQIFTREKRFPENQSGMGDMFSSILTREMLCGSSLENGVNTAMDYVSKSFD